MDDFGRPWTTPRRSTKVRFLDVLDDLDDLDDFLSFTYERDIGRGAVAARWPAVCGSDRFIRVCGKSRPSRPNPPKHNDISELIQAS